MANGDGVYTRNDRCGYWISFKDADGRRRRRKVSAPNKEGAKLARSAENIRAEETRIFGFRPPTDISFAEVAVQYLAHQKSRISAANYERERGIVEDHLKPCFAGELRAIRRATAQRYVTARLADVSGATVTKELNVLKHLLELAVSEWEYIPVNHVRRLKPPKVAPGRVRYLQPTELRAVMEACPLWLRPIVALAAATGMRRSEILKLRWVDVDLKGGRILLPQTKNGEGRIVYLNTLAVQAISFVAPKDVTRSTNRVFSVASPESVSLAFLRLCRKLEIADFHFHDLRHTAASWLRMQGADIHTVAQLLGHKDLRMAARYQHLSPAFLADAVGRLDSAFAECHPYVTAQMALSAGVAASA
ncbi:MAG TPA: site-specific integrase [Terriglobales bacterium]|nr:site-specific integrase [Terriglobales bacterium]